MINKDRSRPDTTIQFLLTQINRLFPIIRENGGEKKMARMITMIIRIVKRSIICENNEKKKMARIMMIKMIEWLIKIIWIIEETIIYENDGNNEKEMARMMIIRGRIIKRPIIRENNGEKEMARMMMITMIIWIVEGPIIHENEKEMAWMMMIRRW